MHRQDTLTFALGDATQPTPDQGASVSQPHCRPCSITAYNGTRRAPNRATHVTFFADGRATLTCNMHMEMALRVGGFAFPTKAFPLIFDELSHDSLHRGLTAAIVATGARAAAREAVYESDIVTIDDPEALAPGPS
jgi:hypothetical protein